MLVETINASRGGQNYVGLNRLLRRWRYGIAGFAPFVISDHTEAAAKIPQPATSGTHRKTPRMDAKQLWFWSPHRSLPTQCAFAQCKTCWATRMFPPPWWTPCAQGGCGWHGQPAGCTQ